MKTEFFGKQISGPFTIPSGIVTTAVPIMRRIMAEIPEIGVITTKSIGPVPRPGNREPIMSQYAYGCYINAVGLTNPGVDEAAAQLAELEVPDDKFLLTSIFAGDAEAFAEVARKLAPVSDGLELNLSCPHASGYGMDIGQNPELVKEIVAAVKAVVDIPVIAKLTPNVPNIGSIAKAAADGGADGICAINTVGPGYHAAHGEAVLTNQKGGLSGKGVMPIALKCVREIHEAVDVPIIACGGISTAEDVKEFQRQGATIVGIGSVLTGLSTAETKAYFAALSRDLTGEGSAAADCLALDRFDMGDFRPYKLVENQTLTDDLAVLVFEGRIDIKAGEFVFAWIPGLGEKPFSVLRDEPFTLAAIKVGIFTSELVKIKAGTTVYIRGPYGIPVDPGPDRKIFTVSGGTGLAANYQIGRDYDDVEMFIGARSKERLYFLEETKAVATVHVATNDGSAGHKGLVTEPLEDRLQEMSEDELKKLVFYNCGPAPMVHAAREIELKYCSKEQIFNAIDYETKCGVGICGACYAPDGRRLCVDGPYLEEC